MRSSIFLLMPVLIVVIVAASGCLEERLAMITNETHAPIRVKYLVPVFRVDVGAIGICPLSDLQPLVRPIGDRSPSGWTVPRDLEVDIERCEASHSVEPGFSALVYRNGFCDDYEQYADQGTAVRPSLEYLAIETAENVEEWRGWDAAKPFKRTRAGSCLLRVL
jgi:hypothetical protein